MKNKPLKQFAVVTLLSAVVLALFQALATPALAESPAIVEETWDGHIWSKEPLVARNFNAPASATAVEIVAEWGWSGGPGQIQTNEKHEVRLPNGQMIQCDDYGDEELDGQWFRCGSTKFEWDDDLGLAVAFTGDNSSKGSHLFKVTVRWYSPPTPTLKVTVDCTGAHFIGETRHPMELVYKLSDGQLGTILVEGAFSEMVEWNPQLEGSYGLHTVSAEAELVFAGETFSSDQASDRLICSSVAAQCTLTSNPDGHGNTLVDLGAIDEDGNSVSIEAWKSESSFGSGQISASSPDSLPTTVRFPQSSGAHWVQFEVLAGDAWLGGQVCRIEKEISDHSTGQYQDFIGAVPFGTFTPYLEPGKEYFDGTRSLMFNVEFITEAGEADVVFRFNGREVSNVTTSIFNNDTFRQVETNGGRAVTSLDDGVTKLIAYRYGAEQARIYQTFTPGVIRWIHPLDQPFEHKYGFTLELHGPAETTDLLVYGDQVSAVRYDQNGRALVDLTFAEPGLVAIYPAATGETEEVEWTMVEAVSYPISTTETVQYEFAETGLYHYRLVDDTGRVVTDPSASSHIEFNAEPGMIYYAQLAYPATSLFVGLYDDMQFQHPGYWTMPIDGRLEHDFEFHLDYHRLGDPDLGNDHIRGDVVVDALYLTNGTTSVAQQFPYGRHDGALPGVTIVGIPTVSMVAFCQRPGMHEVVYWGGWENESYYLPDRSWVFDEELYNEWTEDQRGDCIDAAQRVNMELARQALRTDHTYRYHGELSQGYQMAQQHIWSPYNLVGMRPPHIGKFLKPGTVLTYYEDPTDTLFWAWDLENCGLDDGIGAPELQTYVDSLGPVVYGDQTGIHPPEEL